MWHLFTYNRRNSKGKIKDLHIDFVIKRIELGFLEENYSVGRVTGTTPFFFLGLMKILTPTAKHKIYLCEYCRYIYNVHKIIKI